MSTRGALPRRSASTSGFAPSTSRPRAWTSSACQSLSAMSAGATEEFNQQNADASLAEASGRVERILAGAAEPATVTISVAFGCPFEGRVDPGRVAELAARFEGAEVVLADTIGVAAPREVRT